MLNSVFYGGDTNIKVNAVSGGIVKNHRDSYFLSFHLNSRLADTLLSPEPHRMVGQWKDQKQPVEILQMTISGDMYVIAEVLDLKEQK